MDYKIDPKQVRDLNKNIEKMKMLADIREVDPDTLEIENHRLRVVASSTGGVTKSYVDGGDKNNKDYIDGKIDALPAIAKTGDYNDLGNKPALKKVATTGKFSDLTGIPNFGSTELILSGGQLPDVGEDGTTYLVEDSDFLRMFLDAFYPVGSYYETSNASFNPNVTFGGTWVEDTAGRMLLAIDPNNTSFNTIGTTSGEIAHKLTVAEMPSHGHVETYGNFPLVDENGNNTEQRHGYKVNLGNAVTAKTNLTDKVGNGVAHNNMPPYIVVKRWHRTA